MVENALVKQYRCNVIQYTPYFYGIRRCTQPNKNNKTIHNFSEAGPADSLRNTGTRALLLNNAHNFLIPKA